MTLLVPDAGECEILDCAFKDASPEALSLRLYSNNYDAVEGSTAGSFTECSGGGYAAKALTRAGWNSASSAAGVSSITYGTAQTFSFTGAVTVVGYFVIGGTSGTIYWAERLYAGAGQAFANGDSLTITPKFALE